MKQPHLQDGDVIHDDPGLYHDWPWIGRPPVRWPNGARVAFWVAPNVEFYQLDPPAPAVQPKQCSAVVTGAPASSASEAMSHTVARGAPSPAGSGSSSIRLKSQS